MSADLTDQLRTAMQHVPVRVPPGMAGKAYLRYRTRRLARRAAVTVTAGVACAAAVIAVSAAGASAPARPATPATAFLASHVVQALDAISPDTVVFVYITNKPANSNLPPQEMWAGKDTSRTVGLTPAGHITTDDSTTFTPRSTTALQVDYQKRTWWRSVGPGVVKPAPAASISYSCSTVSPTTMVLSAPDMAASIRTEVACGELKAAGASSVDGVRAVKLTGKVGSILETYWINAVTYLPVRINTEWLGTDSLMREDIQWLPPTAANLAKLTVPIPSNFTQITPPPGQDP